MISNQSLTLLRNDCIMRFMSAAVFTAYLIVLGTGYWLRYLNLNHLKAHGRIVPPKFQGVVDPALLKKIILLYP